ncbi:NADH:flavin oxidoreductase/NADH oxidase [Dentipellis sp. KUC8613]|nr:NADH:flavin oxidoreductase/NADH oxidase [Dentipellis sp. KUC8613]
MSTSTQNSTPKLFQPYQFGDIALKHRVVLAPLTRFRANDEHVHGDLAVEYYSQRASVPGTLIITEGAFIAPQAGGYDNVPGIWSDDQIAGWKRVTDAVHAKGSYIIVQLWSVGRVADPEQLKRENPAFDLVSASDIPVTGGPKPRALTKDEIKEYVQFYATAAANAVHKAGFDGVEVHCGNGYLLDQFIQDVSNRRTDEYGGSVEGRARFPLEIVEAVTRAVGQKRVGIRFSPWGTFQDMRMEDPKPTFAYLATQLRDKYPDFGYIHMTEPRVSGALDAQPEEGDSNQFIRDIWPRNGTYLTAGGYKRATAIEAAEKDDALVVFGRSFLANPDLPFKLKKDLKLNPYDRDTFYVAKSPVGYIDYPFSDEFTKES